MKILHQKKSFLFQALFLFTTIFLLSCQNNTKDINKPIQREKKPDSRMTDIIGAMEYEFNMLKNPITGKIPEGIRDMELAQAKDILTHQQLNVIEAINSYSFQGPENLGGRTRALKYDVRFDGVTNSVMMAGGVSGGIFKSVDNGASWVRKSPLGDLHAVTALAQDTRVGFRDIWYYAGGEWTGNSASASGALYRGKGVYKSTDNGETWTHLPASNTGVYETFDHRADYITNIVVDPTTGNVYIAAMDAIYRSTDGGTTWGFALTSGAAGYSSAMPTDIVVTSTGRFYASFAGGSSTAPTNMPGVWSSTTGASGSWTKIAGPTSGTSPAGWNAAGAFGRCVLAFAPSLESRLYAVYTVTVGACTPEAELFRWDDGSSTWTELSANVPDEPGCLAGNDPFAVQSGYDLVMAVKPDDPDVVFIGGTNIYRSTSGFTTTLATTRIGGYASPASYALYPSSHPDIHAIAFPPTSSTTMLCGNDGGIQRTTDNLAGTVAWTQINTGYRTYQYYYVDVDPRLGNSKVIGGAQDNGSTRNIGGTGTSFESVMGGDGVSVGLTDLIAAVQYEYVGFQLGDIIRRDATLASGFGSLITPTGEAGSGLFVTLFKLDPDNTQRLYYANDNALYRTTTASTVASGTWTSMTGVATAVGAANDITALATSRGTYSAVTSSLFFGTSNGRVFRLDDPTGVAAATAPVEISLGAGFPTGYISSIAVNPRNDDTILVTLSNYGITGNVWWTGNANAVTPTWTNVEGALTLPSFRSAAIHAVPGSAEVQYYIGTSVGLYRSGSGFPGTPGWTQEGATDLGNAVVSSLSFRPSDAKLLVGTHGYGMWSAFLSLFPVPVTLTEFSGTLQNGQVLLQWSTSSEVNSKHFELEKSWDGTSYKKIATIPAAGYSNSVKKYSFTDREKLSEKNFYRLRSVDIDENEKMSNIVLIKPPGIQQEMIVLGNPFKNNISIRFVKAPEIAGELRLIDMSGRLIAYQKIGVGQQQVQINLGAGRLSPGMYHLQAVINGKKYIRQVLKE